MAETSGGQGGCRPATPLPPPPRLLRLRQGHDAGVERVVVVHCGGDADPLLRGEEGRGVHGASGPPVACEDPEDPRERGLACAGAAEASEEGEGAPTRGGGARLPSEATRSSGAGPPRPRNATPLPSAGGRVSLGTGGCSSPRGWPRQRGGSGACRRPPVHAPQEGSGATAAVEAGAAGPGGERRVVEGQQGDALAEEARGVARARGGARGQQPPAAAAPEFWGPPSGGASGSHAEAPAWPLPAAGKEVCAEAPPQRPRRCRGRGAGLQGCVRACVRTASPPHPHTPATHRRPGPRRAPPPPSPPPSSSSESESGEGAELRRPWGRVPQRRLPPRRPRPPARGRWWLEQRRPTRPRVRCPSGRPDSASVGGQGVEGVGVARGHAWGLAGG